MTRIMRAHTATFLNFSNETYCVDRFPAWGLDHAEVLSRQRVPDGCHMCTVSGPEGDRAFHTGFSRGAVDSSPTGLRAGAPGL